MSRKQRALALLDRLPPAKAEEILLRLILECVAEDVAAELPAKARAA